MNINPNFNFHSKCEKLNIINLGFAYDMLLFTRGDITYVDLVMKAFANFSKSTGLEANPSKCQVYFGNMEDRIKQDIQRLTFFSKGPLSFR